MPNLSFLILITLLHNTSTETPAQIHILHSEFLPAPVSVNVITPADYTHEQTYPLLYLLHGYSEDFTQWSQITDLQKVADEYGFIIANPDGFRSFYMNSLSHTSSQYESFFFEDLVPFLHNEYNINNEQIFISGLSMGGFGALHLMLANSGYFTAVGSTSGAVEFEYPFWREISHQFLGDSRLANDLELILGSHKTQPNKWKIYSLTNRTNEFSKNSVPLFLDVGTEDPLYEMNVRLSKRLREQGVPVHFLTKPGGHDNNYWSHSIYYHLNFYKNIVNGKTLQ